MIYSINCLTRTSYCHSVLKDDNTRNTSMDFTKTEVNQNISFKGWKITDYCKRHFLKDDVANLKKLNYPTRFPEIQTLIKEIEEHIEIDTKSGSKFVFADEHGKIEVDICKFKNGEKEFLIKPIDLFMVKIEKSYNSFTTNIVTFLSLQKNRYSLKVSSNDSKIVGIDNSGKDWLKKEVRLPDLTIEEFAKCEEIVINGLKQVLEQLKKTAQ